MRNLGPVGRTDLMINTSENLVGTHGRKTGDFLTERHKSDCAVTE